MFSEWQQRLLVETLQASWPGPGDGRPFLVTSNVGLFHDIQHPPVVPDVLLSLDVHVEAAQMLHDRRSYFVWVFGKVPDLVIEIVSQTPGGEDTDKLRHYARLNIPYYAIFDPGHFLGNEELRVFGLSRRRYERMDPAALDDLGLGLTVWEGPIHGDIARWLRWTDASSNLIPTPEERAEQERIRAEQERMRADAAELQATELQEKLARYAAKLRDAGLIPNGE
jgi:hypothetical protein